MFSGGMFSDLVDLVLPRSCPGCGGPDNWCRSCAKTLAVRPRRVLVPEGPTDHSPWMPPVYALTRYTGPARAVILAGKERGRYELPPLLGAALGAGVDRLLDLAVLQEPLWLVPAPSKPAASRRRGGDPVTRMAISTAQLLAGRGRNVGVAPCLFTGRGARDSVGLDAAGRLANLRGRIRFEADAAPPTGPSVVLLDDVLTTGTTCVCAAEALAEHGHPLAAALVLCSVPPLVPGRFPGAGSATASEHRHADPPGR